jgi:hypothetical protein
LFGLNRRITLHGGHGPSFMAWSKPFERDRPLLRAVNVTAGNGPKYITHSRFTESTETNHDPGLGDLQGHGYSIQESSTCTDRQ